MIVRKFGLRQSRQLLALSRRTPVSSRFYSSEAGISVETEVQTPPKETLHQETVPRPDKPVQQLIEASRSKPPSAETEAFVQLEQNRRAFNKLGSETEQLYRPEDLISSPPRPSDVTLELLLASGTHLGHITSRWNPRNSRYIFGIREGVHIIALDVTAAYLRRAAKVVEEVAARGGIILFVGTRANQKRAVVRAAELAKGYHIFERWIPGALTNGGAILSHCEMKVVNAMDKQLHNFKRDLADRPPIKPDLVICLNPLENRVMLHECGLLNVPTIGIIDTDADPASVTYPIPANDDSLRATSLIAGVLGRAGQAGQERRLAAAKDGRLTYEPITAQELQLDPLTGKTPGEQRKPKKQY